MKKKNYLVPDFEVMEHSIEAELLASSVNDGGIEDISEEKWDW